MTAPNLRYASSIVGNTLYYEPTTSLSAALTNAAASNEVYKINSIYCSNLTATTVADITVSIQRSGVDYYIAKTISVPGSSTLMLGTKETYLYLQEGDTIRASASANSSLSLAISYEVIG